MAALLGREERVEDLGDDVRRDAAAGIRDGQRDEVAGKLAAVLSAASCTLAALIVMTPPCGIASRELSARLTSASSNSPASTVTGHMLGGMSVTSFADVPRESPASSRPLRSAR